MKILVFSGAIPATTTMPGSPRLFSLCRYLSRSHQLTLATFAADPEPHRGFLADPMAAGVFDEIVIFPSAPEASWIGQQAHRLRQELHFGTRFRHRAYYDDLRHRLRALMSDGGFDVLYVDGLSNSQYVTGNIARPAAIDVHDCLTLLTSRKAQLARDWIHKLRLGSETRAVARWERGLSRTFGAVITNSPIDEGALRSLDPTANTLTIGNGVDSEYFHSNGVPGTMTEMVFTGVMSYEPNEDAAIHFIEAILPLIQHRRPEARFRAVGKAPTDRLRALGNRPGVQIVGEVPDVRPFLETAGIFVCPLRWGAGVKNKLLAALAMGKPVVATRQSIDGLELREDEHLLIADDPQAFADKVGRLMADPAAARALGQAGLRQVIGRYSWESSGQQLEATLVDIVTNHGSARSPSARNQS